MTNTYIELPGDSGEAAPLRAALAGYQATLFARFRSLASTPHVVTSFRAVEFKAGAEKRVGYRVKIQCAECEKAKWTGELWIEQATSLVWRATLSRLEGPGAGRFDEVVEWDEIHLLASPESRTADEAWKPPVDSQRMVHLPAVLP
jgi:hypothetical protein